MVAFESEVTSFLSFFFYKNRKKIDTENISLENVIIKDDDSMVVGTVKVKNISFQKEVFIRCTWDHWKTQQDTICTYTPIGGSSGAYVLYDTFSFKLTLPPSSNTVEFCVCFRADGKEFWDNNDVCILFRSPFITFICNFF